MGTPTAGHDMQPGTWLTFDRCKSLLERFVDLLAARLKEDLLAVALFGSVARGKGTATSDLDLLVVHEKHHRLALDHFVHALRELRRSAEYAALRRQGFLPDPSPIFFNRTQLAGHPWLLLDIVDDGLILRDPRGVLQAELERLRDRLRALGARKILLRDGTWYWDLKPDWKPGEEIVL